MFGFGERIAHLADLRCLTSAPASLMAVRRSLEGMYL